jgi:hypothetical protein
MTASNSSLDNWYSANIEWTIARSYIGYIRGQRLVRSKSIQSSSYPASVPVSAITIVCQSCSSKVPKSPDESSNLASRGLLSLLSIFSDRLCSHQRGGRRPVLLYHRRGVPAQALASRGAAPGDSRHREPGPRCTLLL